MNLKQIKHNLYVFWIKLRISLDKYERSGYSTSIWRVNPDDYFCCSGFDHFGQVGCGCYGVTNLEYWEHQLGIDIQRKPEPYV
jgi:hypothetical protein